MPRRPPPNLGSSALANISASEANSKSDQDSQLVERITFTDDGKQQTVAGRILIEAQDGGVLLESADGAQYTIEGKSILTRERTNTPFKPFTPAELGEELLTSCRPASASTRRPTT